MEEDSPIKEILYDVIREIPEKEIQTLFENGNHSKLIENLFEKTLPRINTISGDINEKLGILSESMSHYILTEMLIPVSYTHLRAHETLRYRVWRLRR